MEHGRCVRAVGAQDNVQRWSSTILIFVACGAPQRCHPATERMTDEEFFAMEDAGLGQTTGLALVDDLTRVVNHASGFLTSVRLHTRGLLREGVPAEHLLERWAEGFRTRWAGRGITLELVVEPHLHARLCPPGHR